MPDQPPQGSQSIQLQNLPPGDDPASPNTNRTLPPFLTAQGRPFTRSSGSLRGVSQVSESSTAYRDFSPDIRESLDLNNSNRASNFSGIISVNALYSSNTSLNNVEPLDEPTAIQLGLEDALGNGGNWLTKKPDSSLDINREQLDSEGPLSQTSADPPRGHPDEIRAAEEGILHLTPNIDGLRPRSPVKRFSNVFRSISTRILTGQRSIDIPSPRESTVSPNRQLTTTAPPSPSPSYQASEASDYFAMSLRTETSADSRTALNPYPKDSRVSTQSSTCENINNTTLVDPPEPLPPPLPIKLVGRSLKIFGPENKFRLFLYHVLHQVWVEPLVFFLIIFQTSILTIGNFHNIFDGRGPAPDGSVQPVFPLWHAWWVNYCMLAIYICYTLIFIAKVIAYGLWDDSQRKVLLEMAKRAREDPDSEVFSTTNIPEGLRRRKTGKNTPVVRSFANLIPSQHKKNQSLHPAEQLHITSEFQVAPERAFLRSSWARVDFIAVVSYWVSLLMMIGDADTRNEAFIFRLLSSLPILHLLNMTVGTSSILKSLKAAAPLLVNVGLFVGFFW